MDAFDRPETLDSVWGRLVAGYALDAIDAAAGRPDEGAVRRFLDTAARGDASSHPVWASACR